MFEISGPTTLSRTSISEIRNHFQCKMPIFACKNLWDSSSSTDIKIWRTIVIKYNLPYAYNTIVHDSRSTDSQPHLIRNSITGLTAICAIVGESCKTTRSHVVLLRFFGTSHKRSNSTKNGRSRQVGIRTSWFTGFQSVPCVSVCPSACAQYG